MVNQQHIDARDVADDINNVEHDRFQFVVCTLYVFSITPYVVFAVLRTWLECVPLCVFLSIVIAKRAYNGQIWKTLDVGATSTLRSIGVMIMGTLSGCVAGGILGIVFAIMIPSITEWTFNLSTAIRVGASTGAVVGSVYPRLAFRLIWFLPF